MWDKILRAFERKIAGRREMKPISSNLAGNRTKGLFQLRRNAGKWICAPVIYGSGTTFLPLTMTTKRLVDLFTLCRLPHASLAEDCFILEFFDEITVAQLQDFGFATSQPAAV